MNFNKSDFKGPKQAHLMRRSIFDTKNTTSWRDLANKEFFGQIGPKISPFDPYTPKYVDIRQHLVFDQE